jgi:hypothetical protein
MTCVPLVVSLEHFHILCLWVIFKSWNVQTCCPSHALVYTFVNNRLILGGAKLWFQNLWLLCFTLKFINIASYNLLLSIWIAFIFVYLIILFNTIDFVDLCSSLWDLHQIVEIFNNYLLLRLTDKLFQYLYFNIMKLHLVLDIIFS